MLYRIICRELTNEDCGFITDGLTMEEAKNNFYRHGAESPIHQAQYHSATEEEKAEFSKKLEDYLKAQELGG